MMAVAILNGARALMSEAVHMREDDLNEAGALVAERDALLLFKLAEDVQSDADQAEAAQATPLT